MSKWFPLVNEEVDKKKKKKGTYLAATPGVFEEYHVQTRAAARGRKCVMPPRLPEDRKILTDSCLEKWMFAIKRLNRFYGLLVTEHISASTSTDQGGVTIEGGAALWR